MFWGPTVCILTSLAGDSGFFYMGSLLQNLGVEGINGKGF